MADFERICREDLGKQQREADTWNNFNWPKHSHDWTIWIDRWAF
jgi:hypothetical protein